MSADAVDLGHVPSLRIDLKSLSSAIAPCFTH